MKVHTLRSAGLAGLVLMGCAEAFTPRTCEDDPALELPEAELGWADPIDTQSPPFQPLDGFFGGVSLLPGEFTADNMVDLIVFADGEAGFEPGAFLLPGRGDGSFDPAARIGEQVRGPRAYVDDVDADQRLDLILLTDDGVDIFFGPFDQDGGEDGRWSTAGEFDHSAIADLDADSSPDLLLASGSRILAYRNNGDRTFDQAAASEHGDGIRGLGVGAVDGEDGADLLFRPCGAGLECRLELLPAVSLSQIGEPTITIPLSEGPSYSGALALMQLDSDAPLEIILGADKPLVIHYSPTEEPPTREIAPPPAGEFERDTFPWPTFAFVDLADDGEPELLYGGRAYSDAPARTEYISSWGCGGMVFYGQAAATDDGYGRLELDSFYAIGWDVSEIASGDFNGDEVADLVVVRKELDMQPPTVSVLLGRRL